jgi:hypothetical protein
MPAQLHFGTNDSVTFGTSGTGSSNSATFSASALGNIVAGDLLVAWIHCQSSTGSVTPPSGWTRVGAAIGVPTGAASRISGLYYYPLLSQADVDGLPATFTWAFSVSARVGCVVARATGIDLNNIEDTASTAFQTAGGVSGLTITGLTTTNATTLLVGGLHHQNSASTVSPTTTSFMTAFQEYKTAPSGSALANTGSALGYAYLTSSGATGNIVAAYDDITTSTGGELAAFRAGAYTPPSTNIRPAIVGTPTTFTQQTAVTSFTITKPSGVQDGDVLILALSAQSATVTGDFTCSGWSRISAPFEASNAGHRTIAFYALPVPAAALVADPSFMFTSTDSASGGRIAAEMFIVRGVDLDTVTVGTPSYGTTSSQTVTVSPGSSPSADNLLLTAYNAQFTSGIDYTVASGPSGMVQQADMVTSTGSVSKTRLVVYQDDVDAEAIGAKALTWNGVQSQQAGTFIILKGIGVPSTNDGVVVSYTSAPDTLSAGHLFYTSATDTLATPEEVRPFPAGYPSVTAMLASTPFYVAHRGGSDNWPEMSLYGYTQSGFWGVGALELSLARTSDGVWFGLHDATLDRTSGTTGFTASAHTWAEVQAYAITAAGTTNSSLPAQPYMRWEELMAAYYDTHVIFVDPKNASSAALRTELLDMMDAMPGTPTDRFVAKFYGVSGNAGNTSGWAFDAVQRGYQSWGYFYQADAANFATYQGRWTILGMDYTADASTWSTILSYGKPVIGHIIPNAAAATTAFNYGATGIMVSGVQQAITRSS